MAVGNIAQSFCTRCGEKLAAVGLDGTTGHADPGVPSSSGRLTGRRNRKVAVGLMIGGAGLMALGGLALALPLLDVSGLRMSVLQAHDVCSSPFGIVAGSECSLPTLGFFGAVFVIAVGFVLIVIGAVRLSAVQPGPSPTQSAAPRAVEDRLRLTLAAAEPSLADAAALRGAKASDAVQTLGASVVRVGHGAAEHLRKAAVLWRRSGGLRARLRSSRTWFGGLSSGTRRAMASGVVALVLVAIGAFAFNFVNSADYRLSHAVASVASRQPNSDLADPTGLGLSMGVAGAPADVSFSVSHWTLTGLGEHTYAASWLLSVNRDGKDVEQCRQAATFEVTPDGKLALAGDAQVNDPVPLPALLSSAALTDEAAARSYVDAATEANRAFDVSITLTSSTAPDTEDLPAPTMIQDGTLLQGEQVTRSEAVPPQVTTLSYEFDESDYPLYRVVTKPAVPARIAVGTLDPAILEANAMEALQALQKAQQANNAGSVEAALKVLSHADGLTLQGLEASTIGLPDPEALTVTGSNGTYAVRAGQVVVAPDADGVWRINYSGQPLVVLESSNRLHYDGPDQSGGDPSPVDVTMDPITIVEGQATFGVHFSATVGSGDRLYNDELELISLSVNGQTVDDQKRSLCTFKNLSVPDDCGLSDVPIPAAGLYSVSVNVYFAWEGWGEHKYADTTFVAKPQ
jgi:hypothetical protein